MSAFEPTSTPKVGSSRTRSRLPASIQRATMTFCWLPPDSVAITRSGSCGRTEKRSSTCWLRVAFAGGHESAAATRCRWSRGLMNRFSRTVMLRARLSSPRLLETKPMRWRIASRGRVTAERLAVEHDRARCDLDVAEDRPADRVVAGAAQADQAEDLALRDLEGHRARLAGDEVARRRADFCRAASDGLTNSSESERPTMSWTSAGRRGLGDGRCRNALSVAQHGDPIGDAEHLVQTMCDIDDAGAARRAAAAARRAAAPRRLRAVPRSARRAPGDRISPPWRGRWRRSTSRRRADRRRARRGSTPPPMRSSAVWPRQRGLRARRSGRSGADSRRARRRSRPPSSCRRGRDPDG